MKRGAGEKTSLSNSYGNRILWKPPAPSCACQFQILSHLARVISEPLHQSYGWKGRRGGCPRYIHHCDWPACCLPLERPAFRGRSGGSDPRITGGPHFPWTSLAFTQATCSCLLRRMLPPATGQLFIPTSAQPVTNGIVPNLLPTIINLQPHHQNPLYPSTNHPIINPNQL